MVTAKRGTFRKRWYLSLIKGEKKRVLQGGASDAGIEPETLNDHRNISTGPTGLKRAKIEVSGRMRKTPSLGDCYNGKTVGGRFKRGKRPAYSRLLLLATKQKEGGVKYLSNNGKKRDPATPKARKGRIWKATIKRRSWIGRPEES